MRNLIISDLHANAPALAAVRRHVTRRRIDRIFCLGDLVGYGAQPNQIVDAMRTMRGEKVFVRGNHDRVAAGFEGADVFNESARAAALWTRDRLSRRNAAFLRELPAGPVLLPGGIMLCHGSPFHEDDYVFSEHDAMQVLLLYDARVIFFGHTHIAAIYALGPEGEINGTRITGDVTLRLEPGYRYLVNPGSVGQPRDRDTRTAFALFDDSKDILTFLRRPYAVDEAQRAIRAARLPEVLAERLGVGA